MNTLHVSVTGPSLIICVSFPSVNWENTILGNTMTTNFDVMVLSFKVFQNYAWLSFIVENFLLERPTKLDAIDKFISV